MNLYKTSNIQYIVSSFIDSGAGIESPIWFVLALALDSESNFIIVELVFAVKL